MSLTDAHLDAIDRIISPEGKPTFCSIVHADVDLFDEALRAEDFVAYAQLPDFRSRSPYERSLWVWRKDGRCVPELYALAALRFGVLPQNVRARWADGCATHKELSNVILTVVRVPGEVDGRIARNRTGAPAGTPEYRKKYYAKPENRLRQREHAKRSAQKRRGDVRVARSASPQELEELAKRILIPDARKGEEDDRYDALQDPEVRVEIAMLAKTLHDVLGVPEDEALAQARDKVLGIDDNIDDVLGGEGSETS